VAEFFDGQNPRVSEMFSRKSGGFECSVDADDALAWVAINRPGILALVKSASFDT